MITKFLNTRGLLTLGLVSIVTSAFLLVSFSGLIPDQKKMVREARLNVAQLLAASLMSDLARGDREALQDLLSFVTERQADLNSAALRQQDGTIVVQSGNHASRWDGYGNTRSTDTNVIVPLYSTGQQWGQAELAFKPIGATGWLAFLWDDTAKILAMLSLVCFIGFYFYLGRMLRHLDPSRTVPDRVRNALDTLTESLLLVDNKGQIVLANQSFATLMDTPADQLLGVRADKFEWIDRESATVPTQQLPWEQALRDGELKRNTPLSIQNPDGQRRSFLANCSPIMGNKSVVNGVLISLDDITELEEKEVLLHEAREKAEAANQAKSDFLANMSHEIRTPMNAVLGFTELMRRSRASGATSLSSADDTNRYLETISRNGKHLLALINDILDLSKVESGKLTIESIATSPHKVTAEVIDVLAVRSNEKTIELRFEILGAVPETVLTDPARLRQILTNLIGNAIKFTEQGEVVVTQRYLDIADGPSIELAVRDSGIGIPQDKLPTIFDPFTQAESSTTRRFGGTGLGLSISRKFARAMGGDISVDSEPGAGSQFTVTLPAIFPADAGAHMLSAEQAQASTQVIETAEVTGWQFSGNKVLVVDDSAENRELVDVVLSQVGIAVTLAENGQQACELAMEDSYELILMDMQMPVMDGPTATRKLRAAGLKTKIYAFTAHAISGTERQFQEIGCDGYLTKPIDIDQMLALLGSLLNGQQVAFPDPSISRLEQSTKGHAADEVETGSGQGAAQIGEPIVSRLADQPRLRNVVSSFVDRLPQRIQEITEYERLSQYEQVAEVAHWLKGSAGSVGFDIFTDPARELEEAARQENTARIRELLVQIQSLSSRVVGPDHNQQANNQGLSQSVNSEMAT